MKHLKTLITVFAFLLFVASCKKADPIPVPTPGSKKLQKITWSGAYALTQNYIYDTQGRLVKYEDEDASITYIFSTNTVAIKQYRKSENRFVSDITGITDNAGRVTNLTGSYSYNINFPYTEQTAFTYDAEGYLTQFTRTAGNSTQSYHFTVTNGDYTKLIYQSSCCGGYTQITDFYTDKNNLSGVGSIPISPGNNHTGLFGKINKHLKKFEQLTQLNATSPSWTDNYSYVLDGNGYIQTASLTGTTMLTAAYIFQ
jgi:YD repeat-containing protein